MNSRTASRALLQRPSGATEPGRPRSVATDGRRRPALEFAGPAIARLRPAPTTRILAPPDQAPEVAHVRQPLAMWRGKDAAIGHVHRQAGRVQLLRAAHRRGIVHRRRLPQRSGLRFVIPPGPRVGRFRQLLRCIGWAPSRTIIGHWRGAPGRVTSLDERLMDDGIRSGRSTE